ncbi:ParB/RepB/Spo0J family partition protein [Clostridium ihumii]|uniref:ParB/RepB/Spo0J family partition protein n=1 Tax=Clostridium ihumii TaxID=1470356 RepID=UPI0006855D14|nr:ParB/RepB/Spo0J family partition protein [Clostridium ihumii]
MSKFSLTDILNQHSKESIKEEIEEDTEEDTFDIRLINVFDLEPSKENFYDIKDIEKMKQSIELLGIEQNLIVKELAQGKYKVLAGHRRRLASIELVKEGKEEYKFVPCRVKNKTNEILDKLTIIMTNSTQRELSDYEKMRQVIEIEELVLELKKESGIKGRTRDLLSEITSISATKLARYKAVKNNLNEKLIDALKDNRINFSVAYEASQLSESMQDKLEDLLNNNDVSLEDVRELKRQAEECKQIPGQIDILRNESEVEGHKEDIHQEEQKEEEFIKETIIEENQAETINEIDDIENQEQITVEESNEKESIIIEKTKIEQKKGCSFCRGETSISSKGGNFSFYIESTSRKSFIVDNNTGVVDEIEYISCPICGFRI